MSIEKRKDGTGYDVRWRDSAGRQRKRKVTLWRDAVSLDGEMKRKKAMGELIVHEKGNIKLNDFWEVWWTNYATPNLSARTLATYAQLWKKHVSPRLGKTQLRLLSSEDVASVASSLTNTLAPSSTRQCLAILQGVLERAVEWGYIGSNPARGVRRPKLMKRRGRALTVGQLSRLISELDTRSAAIVKVLASTGMRPGELRELRWENVSPRTIEVYAPKTNCRRAVDLRDEARKALLEWWMACGQPRDEALVFPCWNHSGPWTDNGYRLWVRQTFKPAAARAGLSGTRPYDLRHTFVTTLIYEGRPVHEVARQAGHSPVLCLETYAQEFESVPSECPANQAGAENLRARLGI